jgi:ABC-type transporter Mla subunit MlaD
MDGQDRSEVGSEPPWWARMPAPPAMLSATQLEAVLREVQTRREQVAALRDHLATLEQQLAALDQSLRPLLEWTSAWAELERGMLGGWRPPPAGTP